VGIKFSDLSGKDKPAKLELSDGNVISFRFKYGLITPKLLHDLAALDRLETGNLASAEEALTAVSGHLAQLVTKWDVLDADGKTMFPLEAARLAADIPLVVQYQLIQRCLQEMQPGEAIAPES
jgi:hypothetical protein